MHQKLIDFLQKNHKITMADFIQFALHSEDAYYINKNPFKNSQISHEGDFITAPELSQIFGELVAIWIIHHWELLNKPAKINLIELGPGKGTLLQDILVVAKKFPSFLNSISISLLEINEILQDSQKNILSKYPTIPVKWYKNIDSLLGNIDNIPTIVYSNEFFDALPTNQFQYKKQKWHEVIFTLQNNKITLGYQALQTINNYNFLPLLPKEYDFYEYSLDTINIFTALVNVVLKNTGAMLTIDYGYNEINKTNTIRGFSKHNVLDINEIIQHIGNVDITYNVNFYELCKILQQQNIQYSINTQKQFLENMGLDHRAKILLANMTEAEQNNLYSVLNLLTNENEMGNKFKVLEFICTKEI